MKKLLPIILLALCACDPPPAPKPSELTCYIGGEISFKSGPQYNIRNWAGDTVVNLDRSAYVMRPGELCEVGPYVGVP